MNNKQLINEKKKIQSVGKYRVFFFLGEDLRIFSVSIDKQLEYNYVLSCVLTFKLSIE